MAFAKNVWASAKSKGENGVLDIASSTIGAPVNGASGTGANVCGPGSIYIDVTNKQRYRNVGTMASPYWEPVDAGMVKTLRRRNTIAEINAGLTLLPAIAGFKYQLIDATLIAIGGAVTTATAVVINGVQASSTVALISAAVAALTQNTVVKPNTASVSVLADGLSFVENDANTAITMAKTGSNITVATHVDTILTYVLVKS